MAAALAEFVRDFGVRIVGGCCGTTPEHLSAIVAAVKEAEAKRGAVERAETHIPRVSSAMRAITLHQDPPPLLIGERVNAQGSRKVKRLLLAEDYEGRSPQANARDFANYITGMAEAGFDESSESAERDPNAVRVMTAHGSKGLEFDYVFVPGMVSTRWPGSARGNKSVPPALLRDPRTSYK